MMKKAGFTLFFIAVFISFVLPTKTFSQTNNSLESRVQALEDYVSGLQPMLSEFSNGFQKSLIEYSNGLEQSLEEYTRNLENRLNEKINGIEGKSVSLDPRRGAYRRVTTDSGDFLVAVKDISSIENGIKLSLDIGNLNYANYKDFNLKLIWGSRPPMSGMTDEYNIWRQSLIGAEFAFQGKLEKGFWNNVEVDLVPASLNKFGYLEIEMDVSSAEFQQKNY